MAGVSIGKGTLHLTVSKTLTTIVTMLTSMLLARFSTLVEYGTYSQLIIAVNLATTLFGLGIPGCATYFIARADSKDKRKDFLSIYYTIIFIVSIFAGALLVFIIPLIEDYFKNPEIGKFWYFLLLYPLAKDITSNCSYVFVAYGKTKTQMWINLMSAVSALAIILVVWLTGLSFSYYIVLYLVSRLILTAWIMTIANHLEGKLTPLFSSSKTKNILEYSIPIGLASLVGTISMEVDKLMIGNFLGTEALATYANAGRELPLTMIAASLTAVLLPLFARQIENGEKRQIVKEWHVAITFSYIFICFFSVACISFAPQIMTFLYSDKYLRGVPVFQVYSAVLILRTTNFGIILNSSGNTKILFKAALLEMVLNVILNYIMFKLVGFVGPALATMMSTLFVNIYQLSLSKEIIDTTMSKIFPWKQLIEISIINLVWGTIAFFTLQYLNIGVTKKDIFFSIGIGIVFMAVYILVMYKKAKNLWINLNRMRVY